VPTANLPVEPDTLPDAPEENALSAARERRESEQLITDWERETQRLGHALARMTLDVSAMTGPKWTHRVIIAINPIVESSSFLFYGASFAALFELPETPDHSVPMAAQLPMRYVPVFTKGCIASMLSGAAVRMQGAVEREDGGQELYRAAFIRSSLDPNRRQHFALGAFNCRLADGAPGRAKPGTGEPEGSK
jgi:hypothetical protein